MTIKKIDEWDTFVYFMDLKYGKDKWGWEEAINEGYLESDWA